ncbi:MAG: argininosuccinate synthase, partial [Thermoplasmata archaeon]|nr:argininosuccinate synthase [Thermoplasmata archaeon]
MATAKKAPAKKTTATVAKTTAAAKKTTAKAPAKAAKARDKVVLAYSGGLDTSVAIHWLQDKYDVDVIAI